MYAPKTSAPSGIRHDATHSTSAECVMWCEVSDEHGSADGIRRSGMLQIFGHAMPDIGWQWHSFMAIALASHTDRASAPIDIVNPEPSSLSVLSRPGR